MKRFGYLVPALATLAIIFIVQGLTRAFGDLHGILMFLIVMGVINYLVGRVARFLIGRFLAPPVANAWLTCVVVFLFNLVMIALRIVLRGPEHNLFVEQGILGLPSLLLFLGVDLRRTVAATDDRPKHPAIGIMMTRSIVAAVIVLLFAGMVAVGLSLNSATGYLNRGRVHMEKGDYDAAIGDYNAALRLNPNDATAYHSRGTAYLATRHYDAALRDYNAALRLNPNDATYDLRGATYLAKGHYDAALRDFNMALSLNPNNPNAYANRGRVYSEKGDYGAALRDYDVALRLEPNSHVTYLTRGVVKFAAGRFSDAATDFAHGLRIDPKSAYDMLWLHVSRARAGQADRNEFAHNTAVFLPIVGTNQAFAFSMEVNWETWPRPVIGFFLRQVPADQLLNGALALEYLGKIPDTQDRRVPYCDAVFYIGEQELLDRDFARARQHFQQVRNSCPRTYLPYFIAKAELSRMTK